MTHLNTETVFKELFTKEIGDEELDCIIESPVFIYSSPLTETSCIATLKDMKAFQIIDYENELSELEISTTVTCTNNLTELEIVNTELSFVELNNTGIITFLLKLFL